jgi:transcriptional regulator with XRE-family HTH domain
MDVMNSLGDRVRRLRTGRHWTLDQAAGRLGISRRLLIQIEGSEANPSLSTLLSIAQGFDVTLPDLLDGEPAASTLVRPDRPTTLWSSPAGSHGDLCVGLGPIELWRWTLQPGERRLSSALASGSRECLLVLAGDVIVKVGDERVEVGADGSVAFAADSDHEYGNDSDRPAEFVLAVLDPIDG